MNGANPHDRTSHDHSEHGHPEHGHPEHGHSGHGHSHAPADFGRAFAIGIVLNAGFVVVEATYGFLSGSMALVADAGHNLSDVLALLLAWGASVAAKRAPTDRFTYGYKSSTILAALANAALLLVAIGAITFETVHRLADPAPVQGMTVIVVASIGIAINAGTALLFMRGRQHDLNIRGAYLHMVADAMVSAGVVLAGIAILFTGADWIDPAVSFVIVLVIAWSTWGLLKDSVKMSLMAVPQGIDQQAVRDYLMQLRGVENVHDLHIWPMSTTQTALTAHLVMPIAVMPVPVMPSAADDDRFLQDIADELRQLHRIHHITIQIERGGPCATHDAACVR